jgi:hypothetical protein
MVEAERISEMLVNFYKTTWRYNPEDGHLRTEFIYIPQILHMPKPRM